MDLPKQAEKRRCNLNSGGDACRRTRTDLEHVEDSRRVTFDGVALSSPHGQGVLDTVSTPPHVSPTPAPPASIPTHLVTGGSVPHASASGVSGLPTCGRPECNDAAPVEIGNDRPWPPHQVTTDLDEAIPRQRWSSTYFPLSPSTTCGQASPEPG